MRVACEVRLYNDAKCVTFTHIDTNLLPPSESTIFLATFPSTKLAVAYHSLPALTSYAMQFCGCRAFQRTSEFV